jgi:hypothetical protein
MEFSGFFENFLCQWTEHGTNQMKDKEDIHYNTDLREFITIGYKYIFEETRIGSIFQ